MNWPAGTPIEVTRLADALAAVLKDHSGTVAGPAVALTFAYVVCELGGHCDDSETLRAIMRDVGELARKYGALKLPVQ